MIRAKEATPAPSPHEVFERARRSVLNGDATGFANLFASDGVLELPFGGATSGLPDILEGREEIRRHVAAAMMEARQAGRRILGYDDVMLHQTADPEVIIAEFDVHGEVRGTGKAFQHPYVQVFRIRDGQIVWLRDYFSSARLHELDAVGTVDQGRDRRGETGEQDPALDAKRVDRRAGVIAD